MIQLIMLTLKCVLKCMNEGELHCYECKITIALHNEAKTKGQKNIRDVKYMLNLKKIIHKQKVNIYT